MLLKTSDDKTQALETLERLLEREDLTASQHKAIKKELWAEFLRWNAYQKCYEGMSSPIAQNQNHTLVLEEFFKSAEMPTRLGMKLKPSLTPFVLVSNNARIQRPKSYDTSSVIKCDQLFEKLQDHMNSISAVKVLAAATRLVSAETLQRIGRLLKYSHKPIEIDYLAKFGLSEEVVQPKPQQATKAPDNLKSALVSNSAHTCGKCQSSDVEIRYGRNYYFKCLDCDGNTPIKLSCAQDTCKSRIRKQKSQFFKECSQCGTSELFHENGCSVTA